MANGNGNQGGLAVVLSGGGARASYQVGVLCAIAEIAPDLSIPIVTGVSAGAINSVFLAAHPGPFKTAVDGLNAEWAGLTTDRVYCVRPIGLARIALAWLSSLVGRRNTKPAPRGLLDMSPLNKHLSRTVDVSGIDSNIAEGRLRAVALSSTSYTTGATVTFVHGAEDIDTWTRAQRFSVKRRLTMDHVMASAAVPIVFPAVELEGEYFGDGSMRQAAPLAPAIHLGADKLIAISMRHRPPAPGPAGSLSGYPSTAEVLGLLLNAVFLDALDADAERLERVNLLIESLPRGEPPSEGLRKVELLMLRPSRDIGSIARGMRVSLPPLVRWVVRSIGGSEARGADFMSYLLFEPEYTTKLMELGYDDGLAERARIERFLES